MILAGRGWGKTRTGAETTIDAAKDPTVKHIAIVGQTFRDVKKTMMYGEGGIMTHSPPGFMPKYVPTDHYIEWPNGVIGTTYSADTINQFRGPGHGYSWCDEVAKWQYPEETLSNLRITLRVGDRSRMIITGTPLPTKSVIALAKECLDKTKPRTLLVDGFYRENERNLSRQAIEFMEDFKETNPRFYKQEACAQILDDNPYALWNQKRINESRIKEPKFCPTLVTVGVGVDPNASNTETSDEMGIVVVGCDYIGHHYILGDYTTKGTVNECCKAVARAYDEHKADVIVFEKNQGGYWVHHALAQILPFARILDVNASRGKETRAQPIALHHERRMSHFVGTHPLLEAELCEWIPRQKPARPSPDRMDALVHIETYLLEQGGQNNVEKLVDITADHGVDLFGVDGLTAGL